MFSDWRIYGIQYHIQEVDAPFFLDLKCPQNILFSMDNKENTHQNTPEKQADFPTPSLDGETLEGDNNRPRPQETWPEIKDHQSVEELVEDVNKYLDGNPLLAGPESTSYRLKKFIKKQKLLVAGLASVVVGLVAGTIISIVLLLQTGTYREALEKERCRMNCMQIGNLVQSWDLTSESETGGRLLWREPRDGTQKSLWDPYVRRGYINSEIFQCPSDREGHISYAINKKYLDGKKDLEISPYTVILFEADADSSAMGGPEDIVFRHKILGRKGCNILFANGKVEFITEDMKDDLIW